MNNMITLIIIFFSLSLLLGKEQIVTGYHNNTIKSDLSIDREDRKSDNIFKIVARGNRVNGLAIEYFYPETSYLDSLTINGVYLDLNPIDAIAAPFGGALFTIVGGISLMFEPIGEIDSSITVDSLSLESYRDLYSNDINGLSLSFWNMDFLSSKNNFYKNINGVDINLSITDIGSIEGFSLNTLGSHYTKLNGCMISGLYSSGEIMEGVSLSLIHNYVSIGRGLQIGLLNISDNYKGVQLGLWNVNQDRGFPIINWSF